ncbi:MAG: M1 family metallopeptidase [Steroidobacteraceae bacterium]
MPSSPAVQVFPRPAATLLLSLCALAACSKSPPDAKPAVAAAQTPVPAVLTTPDARDVHSFAEPARARVTHVDLDLVADFDSRTFSGSAALDVEAAPDAALTLDTRDLDIESVQDDGGRALPWQPGATDPVLGTPLRVELGSARRVVVHYRTRPGAAALQWLAPAQTAGGRQPFLYSQGEAILNRSWIPTQDSPGIRQTWSARITAPAALTVVMSAQMLGAEPGPTPAQRTWKFRMDEPVAPYLIAIGIGDLGFRELGPRTGVYAEPPTLAAAAAEFADIEKMVAAAEELYGPYRWGRYDLLVLPPAFPFGGMENPRLTFVTPTVIAGDRSLVTLLAHELAHSWSGNLVTNATWADFWLNEGFTVYIEGRIMERVFGKEAAAMQAALGWDSLQAEIKTLGGPAAADTRLHIDLAGRDPDEGMTDIAYEKGANFLRSIEAAVGRERFDAWLRGYFDRHAFQPQTTAGFLADLRANLVKGDAGLEQRLQLDRWAYEPGLPDDAVQPHSEAFSRIDAAVAAFAAGRPLDADPAAWSSAERVRFLNRLPRRLSAAQLGALSQRLSLATQHNSEVRFAWLRLAIANRYEPAMPQLEEFLASMGRRKFVLPLFQDLVAQGTWGRQMAVRIYARTRPGYHSLTVGSVDKVVTLR